jgi:peptidoglycan/LPS O-acetylase OafA/YrhL
MEEIASLVPPRIQAPEGPPLADGVVPRAGANIVDSSAVPITTAQTPASGFASLSQALVKKLSRVTSSGRLLAEVDGLRFVAIAWVVLLHVLDFTTERMKLGAAAQRGNLFTLVVGQGRLGVRLFFAISGLILGLPFAEHYLRSAPAVQLKRYFVRRLTRLEPPYILNMCFMALTIFLFSRHMSATHQIALRPLLKRLGVSLIYLHNYIFRQPSVINSVAWSLEIEVQFYIVAPLLCLVFAVRDRLIRRGALIVAIGGLSAYAYISYPANYLNLIGHLHYFLLGMLLADLFVMDWKEMPVRSSLWDVIGIVAWCSLVPLEARGWTFAEPLPVFLAYCAAFRGSLLNRFFSNRWLVVIGGMCYTIYLYHPIIVIGLGRVTARFLRGSSPLWLNAALQMLLMVPVILVCSSVLFVFCEKPFMRRDWHLKVLRRWHLVSADR